jgi:hypothetical protein
MATSPVSLTPATDKPAGRWRRLPLALRMFLVVLLGLSACTAWFAAQCWRQAVITKRIAARGGIVEYEQARFVPARLRDLVGRRFVDVPIEVRFYGQSPAEPRPKLFADIVALRSLRSICLYEVRLGPNDLDRLAEMKELETLMLADGALDDVRLDALRALPLTWLALPRSRISDTGLRDLRNLKSLRYLDLTRTRVSDRGLAALEELPNLRTVNLLRTKVTREGAARLGQKLKGCVVNWEPLAPSATGE